AVDLGAADVVGIVQQRLQDVVASGYSEGDSRSDRSTGKWKGLSLEVGQGKGGASKSAGWLGSLFYR
ncbi:MAG: hypothetical protein ABEN55_14800, partial [Bradymonadaceae bacterium]